VGIFHQLTKDTPPFGLGQGSIMDGGKEISNLSVERSCCACAPEMAAKLRKHTKTIKVDDMREGFSILPSFQLHDA